MKRNRFILTAIWALIVVTFFACEQEISDVDPVNQDPTISQNNSVLASSNGRDRARGSGFGGPMGFLYGRFFQNTSGRSDSPLNAMKAYMSTGSLSNARAASDSVGTDCYVEQYTETASTYEYVLDFGAGCEFDGEFIKGKFIEKGSFTDGSFQNSVEYIGFGGRDWEISGTEQYNGTWEEVDSASLEEDIWNATYSFQSSLKETFTEEGVTEEVNYESSGSEQWDEKGFTVLSADEKGTFSDGSSFESKVEVPLFLDFACDDDEVFVFVSGREAVSYTWQDESGPITGSYSMDFGNGACDNLVTITEDGVTQEIDLAKEWDLEGEEDWEDDEEWDDEDEDNDEGEEEVLAFYEINEELVLNASEDGFTSGKITFDIDSVEIVSVEFSSDADGNIATFSEGDESESFEYEIEELPTKADGCAFYTEGSIIFYSDDEEFIVEFEPGCVNVAYFFEEAEEGEEAEEDDED